MSLSLIKYVNGDKHTKKLQSNGLQLTEYAADPLSPLNTSRSPYSLPPAFLLPDGYPDVSNIRHHILFHEVLYLLINHDQYLRLILTSRVYEVLQETPLTHAINISNRLECKVLLKREDLQPVFSFKLRGAYNKMAHLDQNARWKGVVACSAGEYVTRIWFK